MPLPQRDISIPSFGAIALGIAGIALASDLVLQRPLSRSNAFPGRRLVPLVLRDKPTPGRATVTAARRLNRAAGTLAVSVLADSAIEHYRGSFENKAMLTPLVVSALTLATSVHGTSDSRPLAHGLRDAIYALAAVTGLIGTGFHFYNVGRKTGGFTLAELVLRRPAWRAARDFALRSHRLLLGARARHPALENADDIRSAGRTHDGGGDKRRTARHDGRSGAAAFPRRLPQSVDDVAGHAAAGRRHADGVGGRRTSRPRSLVHALVAAAVDGDGLRRRRLHAYGVSRNMGGWRNWSQNILNGPPIPAPPSFAGLALAGLAALGLMEDHPDA